MIQKGKIILKGISVLAVLFFLLPLNGGEIVQAQGTPPDIKPSEEAIIILSTNTIQEMQEARRIIEKSGGKIANVFPPSVFIGIIPSNLVEKLKASGIVEAISYARIDPTNFSDYESSTRDAINFWNKSLEEKMKQGGGGSVALQVKKPQPKFNDKVNIPPDLPKSKEEKTSKDLEYQQHWKQKKEELKQMEEQKRQKWLDRKGQGKTSVLPLRLNAPGVGGGFGKGTGAGYFDSSLYFAGDIAVAIFFEPGSSGNWSTLEIDTIYNSIVTALNQYINDEPNAQITFFYVKEVDEQGNPKPPPDSQTDGQEVPKERDFVNDLRNTYNTHWAYLIRVFKGLDVANTYLFGPSIRLYSEDLREGTSIRHENMHVFGAMDQYAEAEENSQDRWGYLNVVNANSEYNNRWGYFGGSGEGTEDIMIGKKGLHDYMEGIINPIGVYTRGQVGWRDSNCNGLLDPLDTFPESFILEKTPVSASTYSYRGRALDKPLLSEWSDFGQYAGSVTLNAIKDVGYRINGGAWIPINPKDGAFDSGDEDFEFTTPALKNGKYTIEIRTTNSVGNIETSYAKEELLVEGSLATNVQPFASFTVTPPNGSVQTNFVLDATRSSDLEDNPSLLQARWDFDNNGTWDTSFSTEKKIIRSFPIGTQTIKMEVKDSSGLTASVMKQVEILEVKNPKAFFTVTPENRQGDDFSTFDVVLDGRGSYEGDGDIADLQVRWDFEDDGKWDTDYSNNLVVKHSYKLPLDVAPAVVDTPYLAQNVYVAGNYAYVADYASGLQIVDLTNPKAPVIVGSYDTPGVANDVFVSGNYAYVADDGSGLQIIDVSNPKTPSLAGNYDTPGDAKAVFIFGNYAYVADGSYGLQIIDITNPQTPTLIKNYYNLLSGTNSVFVEGNYAYVVDDSAGLKILNITDPKNPTVVGTFSDLKDPRDIFVSGNYAYVADNTVGLKIINITDPKNPQLAGSFPTSDTTFSTSSVYAVGNYAYVADGFAGFKILDVSNPSVPTVFKEYKVEGEQALGVFVSGNYVYFAYGYSGLHVLPLSEAGAKIASASTHWKIRAEVKNKYGNMTQATRDPWTVTYNHSPVIGSIETSQEAGLYLVGDYGDPVYGSEVFVQGGYAYVMDRFFGLRIVEVINPREPKLIGNLPGFGYAVYTSGKYAYIAGGSKSGLKVVDISDPYNPTVVGTYDTPGTAYDVYVVNNYAYVADGDTGLLIINVADPTAPSLIGAYDTPGVAQGVYVLDDFAYVADSKSGLKIIDISNPAAPTMKGEYLTPGFTQKVKVQGKYAYILVEDFPNKFMHIIDISNPSIPFLAGSSLNLFRAHDIYVEGDYAYIAWSSDGLLVLNIKNPSDLTKAAGIYPDIRGPTVDGVYVKGNYVYLACEHMGLQVVKDLTTPSLKVSALGGSDPDSATKWDGLLEYRWDFNNDHIWDTRFSKDNSSVFVPDEFPGTNVACEIKDRFGATSRAFIDLTPPPTPVVIDEGQFTVKRDQLRASWISEDQDSGIGEYQYIITQDAPNESKAIRSWTSTGTETSITAGALNLVDGKTYYVGVKARNGAGQWSEIGYSDGIALGFVRGDVNGDGKVDISDAIGILHYVFLQEPVVSTVATDINDDGPTNLMDAIDLLRYLFLGGPQPKPPYPNAGIDPTP